MENFTLERALTIITVLIDCPRMVGPHYYEMVWIKDHFVFRKMQKADKEQYLIIKLRSKDINEGLTNTQWSNIIGRVRTLIETGVIK